MKKEINDLRNIDVNISLTVPFYSYGKRATDRKVCNHVVSQIRKLLKSKSFYRLAPEKSKVLVDYDYLYVEAYEYSDSSKKIENLKMKAELN